MTERIQGRIVNVWTTPAATTLKASAAVGATVLSVDDASIFNDDGDGGSLLIGSQVTTCTAVDDDAGTVTIPAPGLTVAADADDSVSVWSELYGVVDDRQWAAVQPDGKGDRADDIDAIVDDGVELTDGDRGKRGEACELVRKTGSDTWTVKEVFGRPSKARGPKWESNDPHTLTAGEVTAGTFTHTLLHSRIVAAHEFTAYVNGVALGPDRYTLDADAGVVTVTLGGWETTADDFRFHYAYRSGPEPRPFKPTQVGSTSYTGLTDVSGNGTLPMPAGTQVGDLLVLAAVNFGANSCSDPRFAVAGTAPLTFNSTDGTATVWIGRADTLANVSIAFSRAAGFDYRAASLTVIRGVGAEQAFLTSPPTFVSGTGPTGNLPAVGNRRSGGVCVYLTRGGTGGAYADQDWSRSPGWTLLNAVDRSYVEVDVALTSNSPNPEALTPNIGGSTKWQAYVFEVLPQ